MSIRGSLRPSGLPAFRPSTEAVRDQSGSIPPLDAQDRLPFPPGKSPFKVKGSAYRGHIEYTNANIPGGMRAAIAALVDPEQRAFFEQPFMASSFYDIYPLMVMGNVCARLAGMAVTDFLRIRSRHQVELDFSGVYRLFLQVSSPESVAVKLLGLWAQYLNFGTVEAKTPASGIVEVIRREVPVQVASWLSPISQAYTLRALELNGAKNAFCRALPFRKEGSVQGVDLVTMEAEYRWET